VAGRKGFVAGEILTAADVNSFLMDQAVMVFDDATARTTAIPSPVEGMVTYRKDINVVEAYTGAAFTPVSGILQVVSTTKTDTFSSSGTSFQDITGLSATITPTSTSSKIMVLVSVSSGASVNAAWAFRLRRASTDIALSDAAGSRTASSIQQYFGGDNPTFIANTAHLVHVDAPNTTSATTYGLQVRIASGTAHINRMANDDDLSSSYRSVSSITVMEVAG
jgi:hypothetical protein